MSGVDLTQVAPTAPHGGLPGSFLVAAVEALLERGVTAHYEYPGMIAFEAAGRYWATAHTGLHVCPMDDGDEQVEFPDARLVALEEDGEVVLGVYIETLLACIAVAQERGVSRNG